MKEADFVSGLIMTKKFKSLVNEKRRTFQNALKNKPDPLQLEHHKKSYFDELRNFNKLKRRKERILEW